MAERKWNFVEIDVICILDNGRQYHLGEEQITEDGERVDYHTVEITISRIRKKLEAYSGRTDFIITIRGRGYKFRK